MEKKSKFMLLVLEEINGEYEYHHRSVHELPNARKMTTRKVTEDYLKSFYGGEAKKENGGYYFHNGEVYVKINSYRMISKIEYDVLNRYL